MSSCVREPQKRTQPLPRPAKRQPSPEGLGWKPMIIRSAGGAAPFPSVMTHTRLFWLEWARNQPDPIKSAHYCTQPQTALTEICSSCLLHRRRIVPGPVTNNVAFARTTQLDGNAA